MVAIIAIALGVLAAKVAAHGHVPFVHVDGKSYPASDPVWLWNPSDTVGWKALNQDNGFVDPTSYGGADIICHKSAKPGELHMPVKAGETITIDWNTWPDSHKGPVINYLAACNGDCSTVDPSSLSFAKISEEGLIDPASNYWAADKIITDGLKATVTIPSNVKAGNYVLRHEIIALHSASERNGAQNYPSCINLKVTGDGTDVPSGYAGTDLYSADEPGILVNIYQNPTSYDIPGPELWDGACEA